jgi:hypothetical protein
LQWNKLLVWWRRPEDIIYISQWLNLEG